MTNVTAMVTFILKAGAEDDLKRKAREVDAENVDEEDMPAEYTIPQALQVVWCHEPEWLHANVLMGWTLDKYQSEDGYRMVWA